MRGDNVRTAMRFTIGAVAVTTMPTRAVRCSCTLAHAAALGTASAIARNAATGFTRGLKHTCTTIPTICGAFTGVTDTDFFIALVASIAKLAILAVAAQAQVCICAYTGKVGFSVVETAWRLYRRGDAASTVEALVRLTFWHPATIFDTRWRTFGVSRVPRGVRTLPALQNRHRVVYRYVTIAAARRTVGATLSQ